MKLNRTNSRILKDKSFDGGAKQNMIRVTKPGQLATKGILSRVNSKRHIRKPSAEVVLNKTNPICRPGSRTGSPQWSANTSTCSNDQEHFLITQHQNLKRDYAREIDAYLRKIDAGSDLFLSLDRHAIEAQHRAKMVDWMIEVLASFKCCDQTFFLSVNIMDRYFKSCKQALPMADLHIVGVVSMFLASKYEDVIPLSLKIVYNKIGHKKLSTDQILSREIEVLEALEFNLMRQTTLYEQIERLAEEHLKDDYKGLRKYYNYYARLVQFDYETLNLYTTAELSVATLWVAVEALEKRKKRTIRSKSIFSRLLEMAKV